MATDFLFDPFEQLCEILGIAHGEVAHHKEEIVRNDFLWYFAGNQICSASHISLVRLAYLYRRILPAIDLYLKIPIDLLPGMVNKEVFFYPEAIEQLLVPFEEESPLDLPGTIRLRLLFFHFAEQHLNLICRLIDPTDEENADLAGLKEAFGKISPTKFLRIHELTKNGRIALTLDFNLEQLFADMRAALPGRFKDDTLLAVLPKELERTALGVKRLFGISIAHRMFCENALQMLAVRPCEANKALIVGPIGPNNTTLGVVDRRLQLLRSTTLLLKHFSEPSMRLSGLGKDWEIIVCDQCHRGGTLEKSLRNLFPQKEVRFISNAGLHARIDQDRRFAEIPRAQKRLILIAERFYRPINAFLEVDPRECGIGEYQHCIDERDIKEIFHSVMRFVIQRQGVFLEEPLEPLTCLFPDLSLPTCLVQGRKTETTPYFLLFDNKDPYDRLPIRLDEKNMIIKRMQYAALDRIEDYIASAKPSDPKEQLLIKRLRHLFPVIKTPSPTPINNLNPLIKSINDLRPGMKVKVSILNVTSFGVFAELGNNLKGLIHISQLADHFVEDPFDVVKLGQIVSVSIIEVNPSDGRIGLSMRTNPQQNRSKTAQPKEERSQALKKLDDLFKI